jgi:hypothetical protein
MRQSHTAIIERDVTWTGKFETEPYEVGWASEAIYFVRVLEKDGQVGRGHAKPQISPDGMHWCDEGTLMGFQESKDVAFVRIARFGTYLRLVGELPPGTTAKVIVYLTLKS